MQQGVRSMLLDTAEFDLSKARATAGEEMHRFIGDLYPICRSITGDGVRQTLERIQQRIPLIIHEVPSGTPVFDWTVPREWNIRDAYVANSRGERVIDFRKSNLHVVSYSMPVRARMRLEALKPHLFSLPEHPDWIPYRTSYYKDNWGFCLAHRQFLALEDDEYDVCIDASLETGHLTYGECFLPGKRSGEVLISCHVCHPSLCNDNLSGVVLATFLAEQLRSASRNYSYRFLFIPGTIGSITWLALNHDRVLNIRHGLVVASVGDSGPFTYKRTRQGNAEIDQAVAHVFRHSGKDYEIQEFSPYGYDERQYCSPGFNLAVGALSRTSHGRYSEYHTSADNLDFVRPESLADSLSVYLSVLRVLERNRKYMSQNPYCEPQLGKRGLYRDIGAGASDRANEMALLWVLNLSDGNHTLLDIADRSGLQFEVVRNAADLLAVHGLLSEWPEEENPRADSNR